MTRHSRLGIAIVAGSLLASCQRQLELAPEFTEQPSNTSALLQAISVIDENVVWVSGHQGTVTRTLDGGATWETMTVAGADTLQFRDVHAVSADTAYLLSAGPGELSRIYKTTDAGRTWTLQFTNRDPDAFFDCFDFWDSRTGIAFSDAVGGQFVIIRTMDGSSWNRVPLDAVPGALDGEGSFAASGTCIVRVGDRHLWIGTGAADTARVLRTADRGISWEIDNTPIVSGGFSGIASLAFADTLRGWAFGGNLGESDIHTDNGALTSDGGRTWHLIGRPVFTGAVYGSALVPQAPTTTLAVVGPKGLDYSTDGGMTWVTLDTVSYWAVAFASPQAGWATGPRGRIIKIQLYR